MLPLKQSLSLFHAWRGYDESGQTQKGFKSQNSCAKLLKLQFWTSLALKKNVPIAIIKMVRARF